MHKPRPPIGRFAPSPTGELHLGSLTSAVASFCHIKSLGGQWLLRIEDTDFERCKPIFSEQILFDLEALGLHWDKEVRYQSLHLELYENCIKKLGGLSYPCSCSRKQLANTTNSPIYPRRCTPIPSVKTNPSTNTKLRLQLPDTYWVFFDGLQGVQWQNPQHLLGDVVIKRQNDMINYILACAIDDGIQGITHVMRGLDILPMTAAQIFINQVLELPTPDYYYHLPLLFNPDGQKLSKQNLAAPINTKQGGQLLSQVLSLLGQTLPNTLKNAPPKEQLNYAIHHWDNTPLKNTQSLGVV